MIIRYFSFLLLVVVVFGCKNRIKSEQEFASIYTKALIKRYPQTKFELNSDLSITSKIGELEYTHFITNAYNSYKAEPDSINSIIETYVKSASDLFKQKPALDIKKIIPVIKPLDFFNEIKSSISKAKAIEVITEKYNEDLLIAYAKDEENTIEYLTDSELKKLSIPLDTLRSLSLKNLNEILPTIKREGDEGTYMITAGGNYETSTILLTSMWNKENFPVEGDIIIAIPNRDLLLICGSDNKSALEKLRKIVNDSYASGSYPISNHLYIWRNNKFESFN